MMSGIELNELIAKVTAQSGLSLAHLAHQATSTPTSKSTLSESNKLVNYESGSKPYNRELWRIHNGALEEDLVNFVLDRSRQKADQATQDPNRKISITLYKEDWADLVTQLKAKLSLIIDNNNKYEWAQNIKLTHQLCSQKYRNLKKVYIQAKMNPARKKFSYKEQFRQIEELHLLTNEKYTSKPVASASLPTMVAQPGQLGQMLDHMLSQSSIMSDHDDIKVEELDDEEMGSESSTHEQSPVNDEQKTDVPFFIKNDFGQKTSSTTATPASTLSSSPEVSQTPSQQQQRVLAPKPPPPTKQTSSSSPIDGELLQNLINNLRRSQQQQQQQQKPTHFTANIPTTTPTPPPPQPSIDSSKTIHAGQGVAMIQTMENISTQVSQISSETSSSIRRLTGLMEKQNSMLEQANRLSQERLDIERQRLELETKRLEMMAQNNVKKE